MLPANVEAAVLNDTDYANSVIPAGGQRRLLMATGSAAGSADEGAADDADTDEGAATGSADIAQLQAEIAQDKQQVAQDTTALGSAHLEAALAVNVTAEAVEARTTAENAFENAKEAETNADDLARVHAASAAVIEAKVSADDQYVSTHRGALHQTSCAEEKKFAFDVCYGRGAYKGQLYETKKAQLSRAAAEKYKADMGKDYAVVIQTNKTYLTDATKQAAAEAAVVKSTNTLESDQAALVAVQQAVKEAKEKEAQKKADAAKAEEQAAAAAAMADAVQATNASALEEMQQTLDTELVQEETEGNGRHLLASHDESECETASDKAFGQCKTVVDQAYAGCTLLFQNLRL